MTLPLPRQRRARAPRRRIRVARAALCVVLLGATAGVAPVAVGAAQLGTVKTGAVPSGSAQPAAGQPVPAPAQPGTAQPETAQPDAVQSAGYLMATAHGAVLSYGNVPLYGSVGTAPIAAPVVGLASVPDGKGYWMVGSDGGIYAFGDAGFYGSMGESRLNSPVVGIARTADGKGYWEVAADGGIFAYGNAAFYGSMGGIRLVKPVQGIAPTPDGNGYWEVASDGGLFAFGDAGFYGSMGTKPLRLPVVGMASTPDGKGYWEVATDGGIFAFGDAAFYGSMGGRKMGESVVGLASSPDGLGYWEAGSAGGIYSFGDAPFRGSDGLAGDLFYPVISFAEAPGSGSGPDNGASQGLDRYDSGTKGYDISWPQCGGSYPPASSIAIVGINDGHGLSTNPCFAKEAAWGGANLSIYMNADFFSPVSSPPPFARNGPKGPCSASDLSCQGYNYGWASAQYSVAAAQKYGVFSNLWWLDVETGNSWSNSTDANDAAIQAMVDYLHGQGIVVGIYSTSYQWGIIAGSFEPTVPNWYATGESGDPPFDCNKGFTGGPTWMVQAAWTGSNTSYDGDFAC